MKGQLSYSCDQLASSGWFSEQRERVDVKRKKLGLLLILARNQNALRNQNN